MTGKTALVTGASGFIGRHMVSALAGRGYQVRAGMRDPEHGTAGDGQANVTPVHIEILDRSTLCAAMEGVDVVFHFAALLDPSRSREELYAVNVDGTRNVWECAAACGVGKAVYCSSTAVYGLLAHRMAPVTEGTSACAVEPYGRSKLLGEEAALEVARRTGLHTTIIRPVAVFGPEEHTPFGRDFRDAAMSRILVAGGFQDREFSYVHVEDVAHAAMHLVEYDHASGEIYNIAVSEPVSFEEAFTTFVRVLEKAGRKYARVRMLASISSVLHRAPTLLAWLTSVGGQRVFFRIWHPGYDVSYSSGKLLRTSFRLRHAAFEEVLSSCMRE